MFDTQRPILGVIGGLGPIATTHFMELTIRMTAARTDQENLDMIVYSFPSIPDRTDFILGRSQETPLPGMLSCGQALAAQGACCIAIPCFTAHYFYRELEAGIPVPIVNGIAETVRHLRENGITHAGIMATDGTIRTGLFRHALEDAGIVPVLPSPDRQADVMHLIYRNIKAGLPAEMDRFHAVGNELKNSGAQAIILGCTELSLIKRDNAIGPGYLDAMEVLARQSLARCGMPIKEEYACLIT